jgi:hypothetical protein
MEKMESAIKYLFGLNWVICGCVVWIIIVLEEIKRKIK